MNAQDLKGWMEAGMEAAENDKAAGMASTAKTVKMDLEAEFVGELLELGEDGDAALAAMVKGYLAALYVSQSERAARRALHYRARPLPPRGAFPMTSKTVRIFVGITGAGKSTRASYAAEASERAGRVPVICSADAFMRNASGAYEFKPQRIGECHNRCLRTFVEALQTDWPADVIVDNTNCSLAEVAPYIAVARAFGVEPTVEVVEMSVVDGYARNVHGVPFATVEAMSNNLDQMIKTWPPFWPALAGK